MKTDPVATRAAMMRVGGGASTVNPLQIPEWDRRLSAFPSVGFFHSRAWAEVLVEAYGFRPAYFDSSVERCGGVLPVMEVSSLIARKRGVSLPFTDECGFLGVESQTAKTAVKEVFAHAAARSWSSWEFRGGREPFGDAPVSQSYFGHTLPLKGTSEEIFGRIDGNARTSVRKALQCGVAVDFATDLGSVRIFHDQLCRTRRRHGLPPQPFGFFESIHRRILSAGLGVVAIARQAGRPVASAIFFHFGPSAIYKFAASEFEFRHLQANHLVLWRAIERYAALGFSQLDFGRTSRANKGLRHFKLAWRPKEHAIDYVKYDFRRARFVEAEPERTMGWHNRVFRLLPVPASKLIGAAIYRHFA
ncbi:MAG: GNAT family N-acetyltransferase [Opitutaceae bacterium]|nr:GNAT family N-acetyltransferase [Opitutaceae bacterium]